MELETQQSETVREVSAQGLRSKSAGKGGLLQNKDV